MQAMKRVLWGEFEDNGESRIPVKPDEVILPRKKAEKLRKLKENVKESAVKMENIQMKNPIVTQTIEVMNQTEMLQTLIDTYASKTGCNSYALNPCQVIPEVDFPPENLANLVQDKKFSKPLWFIPPIDNNFSKGRPQQYQKINQEVAKLALRKAIAGLTRITGFNEASNNALILLTDSVEEFIRSLLSSTKHAQSIQGKDKSNLVDIEIMEKGYHSLTHRSLLTLHNYFKTEIVGRNGLEIDEFKNIHNEYDKLMKESQNMQKVNFKEDDYMNFLDFPGIMQAASTSQQQGDSSGVNIMRLIEREAINSGVLDYLENNGGADTSIADDQNNTSTSGPSIDALNQF